MYKGYEGLIITLTDINGTEKVSLGKTPKGLKRDHRKGKCNAYCPYCYSESMNYLEESYDETN